MLDCFTATPVDRLIMRLSGDRVADAQTRRDLRDAAEMISDLWKRLLRADTGSYTLIVKNPGMSPRTKRPPKDDAFSALEMHDELVRLNPNAQVIIICIRNGKIEAECESTLRAIRDAPA